MTTTSKKRPPAQQNPAADATVTERSDADLLSTYRLMVLAREFEEQLGAIFAAGKLGGWFHSCIGHEATGAAAAALMRETDHLVPYHRSRVSILGKGMTARDLAMEIMGRATAPSRGRAGETHINYAPARIYGTTGVLGANIPIAAGVAYGVQQRGLDEVVVCGFGEGTSNRGAFHEALNMAAIWDLPVIFICENNLYAEFSSSRDQMRCADVADRAAGYGIPGVVVDGNDPGAVYTTLAAAFERARGGGGPTLVEAKTYRLNGHYEGDPQSYRDKAEVAEWAERDPVTCYRARLLQQQNVTEEQLHTAEREAADEIRTAMTEALNAPPAGKDDIFGDIYAGGPL
ncbi:probable pyruvate dehydrogenase (plasmid) [Rhodococcus jostii RHA1]|uniref:Probable pyruvate dehydrogenase n=1 Tax=Rhodococcus jostii (strain RHA1) TaxID=101510 RepID=Q0RVK8_RHOJR|nr:thiamine pyrophosphate-dependent dehydrogenase E1 component subunit alpha [Rhodococcus jostii]ABH00678.1 probable pyruvate dehydrogenase [Rhodococcus jostii RHA1]